MSSSGRNGVRQTANAGNVRWRDNLPFAGKNTRCLISLIKSARNVKIFVFRFWYYIQASFCENNKKKWSFHKFLKTWKSYFLVVDQRGWSQDRHVQGCNIDSETRDYRPDVSHLFYLFKFSFVVYTIWLFQAFCMGQNKQAVKPEVTFSWIYTTAHSKPTEDWWEWWTKRRQIWTISEVIKKCILAE